MKELKIIIIVVMAALAVISISIHKKDNETIYYAMPEHKAEPIIAVEAGTVVNSDFDLFARCVQAEAGNQGFDGKRFVAAVILNRVASDKFPNTISDVIYEKGQFAVAWNGALDKAVIDTETELACRIEMAHRCNTEILYFNNSPQVSGKFVFKHGGHWFGK